MNTKPAAALLLALALAGCAPSIDQAKVDAVAGCVEETRPMVLEDIEAGRDAGAAAAYWLEYCGWDDLNGAEQAATKAAL